MTVIILLAVLLLILEICWLQKTQQRLALLEVGDTAKKQYLKQAEKADLRFLLQAIDLANDCDLKYKSSKNQRLLVELSLLKIASITFDAQKKNLKTL